MSTRLGIYLDANAGSPLRESAREVLFSLLKDPGVLISNPSSIHTQGRQSKRRLSEAKESIARSFGPRVDPEQLVLTSSGTEANQLSVRSILEPKLASGIRPHWITTPIEHDSNQQMIKWLESRGGSVSLLPLDSCGVPCVEAFTDFVRPETALVSMMWVNSETGIIADVPRLAQLCRARSIPLHVDAAQVWGKLPVDLSTLGAQLVTFSGHKIGGLSGVGVLWLERGTRVEPHLLGKQEKGRRGGSENVLGIISVGAAAQTLNPLEWAERVEPLRDRLESVISNRIPGTLVNGQGAKRVANTLNLNFTAVEGESLVMAMDLAGYAVSSGSACSSGALEPSHVLLAMGRSRSQAMAALRISLVDELPWDVLEGFINSLERAVGKVRSAVSNR